MTYLPEWRGLTATGFCTELLPIYSTIYHPPYCRSAELTSFLVFLNENVRRRLLESAGDLGKAMVRAERRWYGKSADGMGGAQMVRAERKLYRRSVDSTGGVQMVRGERRWNRRNANDTGRAQTVLQTKMLRSRMLERVNAGDANIILRG